MKVSLKLQGSYCFCRRISLIWLIGWWSSPSVRRHHSKRLWWEHGMFRSHSASQLLLDITCMCFSETEYGSLLPSYTSTAHILLSSLNPLDSRKWRRKPWSWRVLKVIKVGLYAWDKIHKWSKTKREMCTCCKCKCCTCVLHSSDTVRGAAAAMHPSSGPGQRGQELETTAQLPSTRHRSSRVSVHLPVRTM